METQQKEMAIPVLHIIKSLGRGGAETLLPETLSKHDKYKYEFHYIYFLPWKYQMVDEIVQQGGKVTCISANNNIGIIMRIFKVVDYVRRHKIQLIHCHMPWAGILGRLVGKLSGVPVIYTEHNTWERYHKITFFLNRLSFGNQKKVIAVSSDVANSIKNYYRRPSPEIQIVSNCINTEKFSSSILMPRDIRRELNITDDTIVIGIGCVFRAQKRLSVWLDVAAGLQKLHSNCYFIIVGDGTQRIEIHQKASALGLRNIHFAGLQHEIRPYLKAMNIFMMTSEFEGLPIALLEAMSMGCMPACTAAGGIKELIRDGENGILVPVDEPLLLIDKLSTYIDNRQSIGKIGNEARRTVAESYSLQRMVKEIENIYMEVLN